MKSPIHPKGVRHGIPSRNLLVIVYFIVYFIVLFNKITFKVFDNFFKKKLKSYSNPQIQIDQILKTHRYCVFFFPRVRKFI